MPYVNNIKIHHNAAHFPLCQHQDVSAYICSPFTHPKNLWYGRKISLKSLFICLFISLWDGIHYKNPCLLLNHYLFGISSIHILIHFFLFLHKLNVTHFLYVMWYFPDTSSRFGPSMSSNCLFVFSNYNKYH